MSALLALCGYQLRVDTPTDGITANAGNAVRSLLNALYEDARTNTSAAAILDALNVYYGQKIGDTATIAKADLLTLRTHLENYIVFHGSNFDYYAFPDNYFHNSTITNFDVAGFTFGGKYNNQYQYSRTVSGITEDAMKAAVESFSQSAMSPAYKSYKPFSGNYTTGNSYPILNSLVASDTASIRLRAGTNISNPFDSVPSLIRLSYYSTGYMRNQLQFSQGDTPLTDDTGTYGFTPDVSWNGAYAENADPQYTYYIPVSARDNDGYGLGLFVFSYVGNDTWNIRLLRYNWRYQTYAEQEKYGSYDNIYLIDANVSFHAYRMGGQKDATVSLTVVDAGNFDQTSTIGDSEITYTFKPMASNAVYRLRDILPATYLTHYSGSMADAPSVVFPAVEGGGGSGDDSWLKSLFPQIDQTAIGKINANFSYAAGGFTGLKRLVDVLPAQPVQLLESFYAVMLVAGLIIAILL